MQMGSLHNSSPASQSPLRHSALCVLVLAVSFFAGFYFKTPLHTTGVQNSDVYSSPSPVFPPRRKLTWVTDDEFDPLRAMGKSMDIHASIREYIEGRYFTELFLNGTVDTRPFTLNCFYAEDVNAIQGGVRFLKSGSTGLVCSTTAYKSSPSNDIRLHSWWICTIEMARDIFFIPSRYNSSNNNKSVSDLLHLGNPAFWRHHFVGRAQTADSFGNMTFSAGTRGAFSGLFRGIVFNCYIGDP